MLTSQLAVKYAQALCELAKEKNLLAEVEQQLRLVLDTAEQHADLKTLLYHPRVPVQVKKDTVNKVFGADLHEFVRNFLLVVIDKRRESALPTMVQEYVRLAHEAQNMIEAEVTTVMPLTPEQENALAAKLGAITGKKVMLRAKTDERVIGGVVVKMGDKLIDGSVARRLRMLEAALTAIPVTKIGVTS